MAASTGEVRAYRRLVRALASLPAATAPPGLHQRVVQKAAGIRAESEAAGARFSEVETTLGRVFLAYGAHGIRLVAPARSPADFVAAYRARFGEGAVPDPAPPAGLLDDFGRALAGDRRAAGRLPLDLESLGSFEKAVLAKTLEIPRGEVRTYGWVAREIGRPRATRAVGRALGRNPIPFVIPCHRVVGSSGDLTGYAFGLGMKRQVLAGEGLDPAGLEASARRGERFKGSRTTRIFCFPTCRNARRISPANAVPFRSESEALAVGYRPCRVCRPAVAI